MESVEGLMTDKVRKFSLSPFHMIIDGVANHAFLKQESFLIESNICECGRTVVVKYNNTARCIQV